MRLIGNDRSRFPSNPPDISRKIERQRDYDKYIETVTKVSVAAYDVTYFSYSGGDLGQPFEQEYTANPDGTGSF